MKQGSRRWPAFVRAMLAWPQRLLMALVRGYRFWLSPWLGSACRFEPTCSAYALQALQDHGALRGAGLAGWRLLRCQPWCDGGCDPVPAVGAKTRGHSFEAAATPKPASARGLFTDLLVPLNDGENLDSPKRKAP